MLKIRPRQVWEETISPTEIRRFIVLSVWGDVVEILEDHSSRWPHNTWVNKRTVLKQAKRYRLVDDWQ
jgi:hypothetical protein